MDEAGKLPAGLRHANPRIRIRAIRKISEAGDAGAIASLVRMLEDPDETVREAALEAVVGFGSKAFGPLIYALNFSWSRSQALEALLEIRDPRTPEAIMGLIMEERLLDGEFCPRPGFNALIRYGQGSVPCLIEALQTENQDILCGAIDALGNLKDPRAVLPLIGISDKSMMSQVAWALGEIRDARAVPALIEMLGEEDPDMRLKACRALGDIGDARAVPALTDILGNETSDMRWEAVKALGKIGDTQPVPLLIEILKGEDWHGRKAAARALGKIGDARAVKPLIYALDDEHGAVSSRAFDALIMIGEPAVAPMIKMLRHKEEGYRLLAADALVKLAPNAEIDLSKVSESLEEYAARTKKTGDGREKEEAREWIVETYKKIADAVALRKEIGGVLSKGTVPKPRGKKGMYRMRRATT